MQSCIKKCGEIKGANKKEISDNISMDKLLGIFVTIKHWLLALLMLFSTFVSFASDGQKINVGSVLIDSQARSDQQQAGKSALTQVFVKVSGDTSIAENEVISRAIQNYEQYLVSSRFIQNGNNLMFEAVFNHQKVINLLKAARLPVWASLRPSAIIWVAEKSLNNIEQVTQNSSPLLNDTINIESNARGLSIITPIGDLDDAMAVSAYDVWYQSINKLQTQSMRYGTDYVINASISPYLEIEEELNAIDELLGQNNVISEDVLTADSSVLDGEVDSELDDTIESNETLHGEPEDDASILVDTLSEQAPEIVPDGTSHKLDYIITDGTEMTVDRLYGQSATDLLSQLINLYADRLATRYANVTLNQDNVSDVELIVSNVTNISDYMSIITLIDSFPMTGSVILSKQKNDLASFSVEMKDTPEKLTDILKFDERLQVVQYFNTESNSINLRWVAK